MRPETYQHALPALGEAEVGLGLAAVARAPPLDDVVEAGGAQDGGGEVREGRERVGRVGGAEGCREGEGHVGVVEGDQGEGGARDQAGEEEGEVRGDGGREGV